MSSRFSAARTGPSWTFLTNHAHVLLCIAENPTARVRDLAALVGITERGTQRIIAELEGGGYLSHTREGRCNVYRVHGGRPLRHPVESAHNLDELIATLRSRQAGDRRTSGH
jgi:hypothetical protein